MYKLCVAALYSWMKNSHQTVEGFTGKLLMVNHPTRSILFLLCASISAWLSWSPYLYTQCDYAYSTCMKDSSWRLSLNHPYCLLFHYFVGYSVWFPITRYHNTRTSLIICLYLCNSKFVPSLWSLLCCSFAWSFWLFSLANYMYFINTEQSKVPNSCVQLCSDVLIVSTLLVCYLSLTDMLVNIDTTTNYIATAGLVGGL